MHGNTSAARQNSANGHARYVEATQRAAPLVRGDPHAGQPSTAVRIPPFVASRDNSWIRQWPLRSFLELGAFPGNGLAFGGLADVGQYGDQVKRDAHSDVRHI